MKKLLTMLGSISLIAVSSTSVVSCGTNKKQQSVSFDQAAARKISNKLINEINVKNLGELDDLKPLVDTDDANIFNTDNTRTLVHSTFGTKDYSNADNKIGTYEIAKVLFEKNNIDFNYKNLFGFDFILSKNENDNEKGNYKLTVISDNETKIECFFNSKDNIQLSLNSVIDVRDKEISVRDGNIKTIISAIEKLSRDKDVSLDVYNRVNPNGVRTIDINNEGIGTIKLFDKTQKYGGYVVPKIVIKNYEKLCFDFNGNSNQFYNDRTVEQNEAIDNIDKNFAKTDLDPNKHILVFAFDGLRYKKFKELVLDKNKYNVPYNVYGDYYSQPWESCYGWKTDFTGSITGSSSNIFEMVNNAHNASDMYAYGNFMWTAFEWSVFAKYNNISAKEVIKNSFKKDTKGEDKTGYSDGYIDLDDADKQKLWLDEVKKEIAKPNSEYSDIKIPENPGQISSQTYKNGIRNPEQWEINYSALKSKASFDVTKNKYDRVTKKLGHDPNLVVHYDTMADDEGHAFYSKNTDPKEFDSFYNSKVLEKTFDVYADEFNSVMKKYGSNSNYLILQITDHGRDSVDADHEYWDPDSRRGFMISNQNLENYISTHRKEDINQYSIKEIVWNFLKK